MNKINALNFFPFPFIICILLIVWASIRAYKRGWFYLWGTVLFGLYLMMVIAVIFFPIPLPENWPDNLNTTDTIRALKNINLIPFNYRSVYSDSTHTRNVMRDVIANILLTIPFGIGECFFNRFNKKQMLYLAILTGLVLEGTQLIIKLISGVYFHTVDINDVLWNAAGVLIGCLIYRALSGLIQMIKGTSSGK